MDAKRQAATEIVKRLRVEGFQAYLVGGCVRDLVMGREPKDYDVATDATPEQVVKLYPERSDRGRAVRRGDRAARGRQR